MLWEELKIELGKGKESNIYFETLLENKKLEEKYPEIYKLVDKPEIEKYHPSKNSFKHTMIALKRVQDENDLIKFAVLCHDLGKGETPNEILPHHYAHEQRGLKVIDRLCERISVPKEYKEFEEKRIINTDLFIVSDFFIFLDLFSNIIKDIQNDIDTFKNENKVDPFFNGKVLDHFDSFTSFLKFEGIGCTICGILFSLLFSYIFYITYNDTKMKLENIKGYYTGIICSIFMLIAFIAITIYGLNYVFKYFKMVKDVQLKRMSKINKPLKTKVTVNEISVSSRRHDIKRLLKSKKRVSFFELFPVLTKEYVVATFLAVH